MRGATGCVKQTLNVTGARWANCREQRNHERESEGALRARGKERSKPRALPVSRNSFRF